MTRHLRGLLKTNAGAQCNYVAVAYDCRELRFRAAQCAQVLHYGQFGVRRGPDNGLAQFARA